MIDALEVDQLRASQFIRHRDGAARAPPEILREGRRTGRKAAGGTGRICKEVGIEIVYLDTVRDSRVPCLRRFLAHHGVENSLEAYEQFVLNQAEPGAEEFNAEYFTESWRANGNAYTIEARDAKSEGRNPELIKEVFAPQRVIDMGCGPGALMFLLNEIGVMADGIDFSATSKEIAPPEVADRIGIGSIIDIDLPSDSYDLVICREVFEHMPVLQVQKAVEKSLLASPRATSTSRRGSIPIRPACSTSPPSSRPIRPTSPA